VPVVDIRRRFGRVSPPLEVTERFVLAWTGEREIALRADSVEWFEDIDTVAVEPVADVIQRGSFVTGLAHTARGMVLVQDLGAFLSEAESAELEAALAAFGQSHGAA
jgi:purine-binding chemotaxis protein CheW